MNNILGPFTTGHMSTLQSPAFRYGQGFFTSTRVMQSQALWLEQHVEILNRLLLEFSMHALDQQELLMASRQWILDNDLDDGFLRIQVWEEQRQTQVLFTGGPLAAYRGSAKIKHAPFSRHSSEPLLHYKSFNYWSNQLVFQDAQENGCYDGLMLNERGEICESSRCNVFWFKAGELYTPEENCGLLAGIGRKKIIELADANGFIIHCGAYHLEQCLDADEIFLTNSVRGIVPVNQIEDHVLAGASLSLRLEQIYQNAVDQYINR